MCLIPLQRCVLTGETGGRMWGWSEKRTVIVVTVMVFHKSSCLTIVLLSFFEESISEGTTVKISGFGKFTKKHYEGRMGRNPSTNEPMQIPARNRVRFTAFKTFNDSLNE